MFLLCEKLSRAPFPETASGRARTGSKEAASRSCLEVIACHVRTAYDFYAQGAKAMYLFLIWATSRQSLAKEHAVLLFYGNTAASLTILKRIFHTPCEQETPGQPSRTWLLPLLRQYTAGTSLSFWGRSLMPQARSLVEAAASLSSAADGMTALQYRAMEAQIWGTLPSFCTWPTDVAPALK